MTTYAQMTTEELQSELASLQDAYNGFKAKGLSLNMARGKPSSSQLDLSMPMLDIRTSASDPHAADGSDLRNYGVLDGLPEAK